MSGSGCVVTPPDFLRRYIERLFIGVGIIFLLSVVSLFL